MHDIKLQLSHEVAENLTLFGEMLKKDTNTMLNEALEQYFHNEQQKLMEKSHEDHNAMTNLDFDEFWDDVEI